MKNFFTIFFACLLAILLSFFIVFITLIAFASLFAPKTEEPTIVDNSILEIRSDMVVSSLENASYSSYLSMDVPDEIRITDLINTINKATGDSKIQAILLETENNNIPVTYQNEMIRALDSFKTSGKKIYAYGTNIDQHSYYLATCADSIFIHPRGMLTLVGYSSDVMFYKGLMDKLGIEPQIFYAGQFKSATEPFRLKKMSEPNKLQVGELLDDFWGLLLQRVSSTRKIDSTTLAGIINSGSALDPTDAVSQKLVDGELYDDDMHSLLAKKLGWSESADYEDHIVDITDYKTHASSRGSSKIALIHFDGEIGGDYNEYSTDGITEGEYLPLIEEIKNDDDIKAVVIHVNSPGGDAVASDKIWHALVRLDKKKPVTCYMSAVAASGGYYIAAGARHITAQPHTITGSIGVFMMSFDAQKLFENRIGVSFDNVKRGDLADYGQINRPMTQQEKEITQREVERVYDRFLEIVSASRNLPVERVKEIAQGRVYSGMDALGIRLINQLGLLRDAIAKAASYANLSDYAITEYPKREDSPLQTILRSASVSLNMQSAIPPQVDLWYQNLKKLGNKNQKVLAEIPFQMEIHGITIN